MSAALGHLIESANLFEAFPLEMPIIANLNKTAISLARAVQLSGLDIYETDLFKVLNTMDFHWTEIVNNMTPFMSHHRFEINVGLLDHYSSLTLRFSGIVVIQTTYAEECARRELGLPPFVNVSPALTEPPTTMARLISALEQLEERIGPIPATNAF
jgi:hypothetical protein